MNDAKLSTTLLHFLFIRAVGALANGKRRVSDVLFPSHKFVIDRSPIIDPRIEATYAWANTQTALLDERAAALDVMFEDQVTPAQRAAILDCLEHPEKAASLHHSHFNTVHPTNGNNYWSKPATLIRETEDIAWVSHLRSIDLKDGGNRVGHREQFFKDMREAKPDEYVIQETDPHAPVRSGICKPGDAIFTQHSAKRPPKFGDNFMASFASRLAALRT